MIFMLVFFKVIRVAVKLLFALVITLSAALLVKVFSEWISAEILISALVIIFGWLLYRLFICGRSIRFILGTQKNKNKL